MWTLGQSGLGLGNQAGSERTSFSETTNGLSMRGLTDRKGIFTIPPNHPNQGSASGSSSMNLSEFPALRAGAAANGNQSSQIQDSLYKSIASMRLNSSASSGNKDSQLDFSIDEFPALGNPKPIKRGGTSGSINQTTVDFSNLEKSRDGSYGENMQNILKFNDGKILDNNSNGNLKKHEESNRTVETQNQSRTEEISNQDHPSNKNTDLESADQAKVNSNMATKAEKASGMERENSNQSSASSSKYKHIAQIDNLSARFGIMGLLTTNDYGFDISKFGLSLNSTGNLFSSFGSPWADIYPVSAISEPNYLVPPIYNSAQLPPASTKLAQMSEETLFYIFYSMPKDEMQLLASEELYKRQWRYHKELQIWITKDIDSQPFARTAHGEQGVFVVFDPTTWQKQKKEILVLYEALEENANISDQIKGMAQNTNLNQAQTSGNNAGSVVPNNLTNNSGPGVLSYSSAIQGVNPNKGSSDDNTGGESNRNAVAQQIQYSGQQNLDRSSDMNRMGNAIPSPGMRSGNGVLGGGLDGNNQSQYQNILQQQQNSLLGMGSYNNGNIANMSMGLPGNIQGGGFGQFMARNQMVMNNMMAAPGGNTLQQQQLMAHQQQVQMGMMGNSGMGGLGVNGMGLIGGNGQVLGNNQMMGQMPVSGGQVIGGSSGTGGSIVPSNLPEDMATSIIN
ncbi:hypothetical protein BB559_004634 [Furculomyces boomerangus]|uniref:NOT2/NOT3/NOT5 C-terminal domain-containing protein n=1 Tax=Furculomyces boomerangus TaxID=61424 RepID=A0A2T9YDL6_9FUNG|nr:hypothetical protein BB559_004634 [Furculomyces boomerangus]